MDRLVKSMGNVVSGSHSDFGGDTFVMGDVNIDFGQVTSCQMKKE